MVSINVALDNGIWQRWALGYTPTKAAATNNNLMIPTVTMPEYHNLLGLDHNMPKKPYPPSLTNLTTSLVTMPAIPKQLNHAHHVIFPYVMLTLSILIQTITFHYIMLSIKYKLFNVYNISNSITIYLIFMDCKQIQFKLINKHNMFFLHILHQSAKTRKKIEKNGKNTRNTYIYAFF